MNALASSRPGLLRLSRPSKSTIDTELARHSAAKLSYQLEGATRGPLPMGWRHDDRSIEVGRGPAAWERARTALEAASSVGAARGHRRGHGGGGGRNGRGG